MPQLQVVALISGGKDSFFSILHCLTNGHDVVALANLHPPIEGRQASEDLDSFMYQTIGHQVIPLYEQALGLPLYRQTITGTAQDAAKSYSTPTDARSDEGRDEVEDLLELLKRVKASHPNLNAVSTGAILSDYQRTRVESVALRLNLVPLSYLWQLPYLPPYLELSLLKDMQAVGQDARIIKVASGGLDDSFLWNDVSADRTQTRLVNAMQRFRVSGSGAALGEGGEYETLAISGPPPLWKGRLIVNDDERSMVAGEGGTASVTFTRASVQEHPSSPLPPPSAPRIPPLLDDVFAKVRDRVHERILQLESTNSNDSVPDSHRHIITAPSWLQQHTGSGFSIVNATSPGKDAANQMSVILARLIDDYHVLPNSIAATTILLRSMVDFASINVIYGKLFDRPIPPARVTISCGQTLPDDVLVSLSILMAKGAVSSVKDGLHVQSRSYWAPANIGPYSQAVAIPIERPDERSRRSVVYVAGQIPLIPASMELPGSCDETRQESVTLQAVLALQHLWRIGQIMSVNAWLGAVAFVAASPGVAIQSQVLAAVEAWRLVHEPRDNVDDLDEDNDDEVDVWDLKYRSHAMEATAIQSTYRPEPRQESLLPPCFVAEVHQLPRNAMFEWYSIGLRYTDGTRTLQATTHESSTQSSVTLVDGTDNELIAAWIFVREARHLSLEILSAAGFSHESDLSCTVYTAAPLDHEWITTYCAQVVPCIRIWGPHCGSLAAVVFFRRA